MIDCRQATLLVSRRLDGTLERRERIALRLHLMICRFCARFQRQSRALHRALGPGGALTFALAEAVKLRLDPDARRRISERLRERSGHSS
jgi:Putative zinc-finger